MILDIIREKRKAMNLKKIDKFFEGDRLSKHLNITIVDAGNDTAKCVMEIDNNLLNANDLVHGGALFSLADYTFAVAANADAIINENTESVIVSHSIEIRYLLPANSNSITADAMCISKEGRRSVFNVNLWDEAGNKVAVAKANGTLVRLK